MVPVFFASFSTINSIHGSSMASSTLQPFCLILKTSIFITLLSSISYSSSSVASARCSDLYGQPSQHACLDLLRRLPSDGYDHLFSLLHVRHKPSDISSSQWQLKQRLPYLQSNGAWLFFFFFFLNRTLRYVTLRANE